MGRGGGGGGGQPLQVLLYSLAIVRKGQKVEEI